MGSYTGNLPYSDEMNERVQNSEHLQIGTLGVKRVTLYDINGNAISNGGGKTILSAGGSAASSGDNTIVAAGTARIKVCAFSLTTLSTTAMTCIFKSSTTTELWRVVLQAPTGVSAGANLATPVPGWLFATASATLLNLNLSSANAVHWSVSYYDEI